MKRRILDTAVRWLMRCATYSIVAIIAYIIVDIVIKGVPAISWAFLTGMPEKGGAEGGILPAIAGTFYLILGTIAVALPQAARLLGDDPFAFESIADRLLAALPGEHAAVAAISFGPDQLAVARSAAADIVSELRSR